jgi:hypothetical protein
MRLLDTLRRALCIKTTYLDPYRQEQIRLASNNHLKEPWGFSEDERPRPGSFMVLGPKPAQGANDLAYYVSSRSRFGQFIRNAKTWGGTTNPLLTDKIRDHDYDSIVQGMLDALTRYGIIEAEPLSRTVPGYRINAGALTWRYLGGEAREAAGSTTNRYFRALYLDGGGSAASAKPAATPPGGP